MPEDSESLVKNHRPGTPARVFAAIERRTLAPQQLSLAEIWKTFARRKLATLSCAAIIFLSVAAYTFLKTPLYEGVARLQIDPNLSSSLGLDGNDKSSPVDADSRLKTEVAIIQSNTVALHVLKSLGLFRNPHFADADTIKVNAKDLSDLTPAQRQKLLDKFYDSLTVKVIPNTQVVEIRFRSVERTIATGAANSIIDEYIQRNFETRVDSSKQVSQWLAMQMEDVKTNTTSAQQKLAEFQKENNFLGDESDNIVTDRLKQLNEELTQAEADRIQLQAYVSGLESGNDVQQVSSDLVIQNLTQKLADVRTALSEAVVVYGANHPNVKKLQNQASELQLQINAQRKAIIGRLKTSYADAQVREKLLRQEMRTATDQASHVGQYNILKKEAQTNRDLYNTLYTRVKEASISAESKASNIRVVDRARILDRPTRPDRLLITIFGLLAGVLGGVVIAFLKERFDTTVRHPDDMRRSTGISGISVMPTFESTNGSKAGILEPLLAQRNQANFEMAGTRSFFLERPRSREAEALRALQTSIMVRWPGDLPHVIQIVSACPGEGKTTIAVNLAVALSKQSRTCLVDADLRKPGIAASFGLFPHQGLGEVLAGSASLEATLVDAPGLKNLSILPSCPSTCPEQFLVSPPAMQQIVWALRQQFQQVIIDSAPLIAYADGRAIASLVDGLILVGRFGYTTREAMAQTIALLAHLNAAPIIEVVLNDANYAFLEHEYRYQANT